MKRIICLLLVGCLLFGLAQADGDPNVDGSGGGDTGGGSSAHAWNGGDDGVRVTILLDGVPISILDYSNVQRSRTQFSFRKQCKLYYKNGGELTPNFEQYTNIVPTIPLPRIISSNGSSNIDAIRRTFTTENRIRDLAVDADIPYEELVSGAYKLMLEPISYFKYDNIQRAMTATEAALYDVQVGGDLSYWMWALTHQNQPLSMFLERPDLGIRPWTGATSGRQSDIDIINYLGVGIVSFRPSIDFEPPEAEYTYRTDTDVITAALIPNWTLGNITPDDGENIAFAILDRTYKVQYACPAFSSQLVWVKWHTPKEPQEIDIQVSHGGTIKVSIVDLSGKEPPDPDFYDRNPGLDSPEPPEWAEKKQTTAKWSEWIPIWVPPTLLEPGHWIFERADYTAELKAKCELEPDERVQTAIESGGQYEMKSGYGINVSCDVSVRGGRGVSNNDVTPVQNIAAVFPEFDYKTYLRLLTTDTPASYQSKWTFRENPYSYYKRPVHFTPLWYPDSSDYTVPLAVFDAWTPGGQLYTTVSDTIKIDGNVYQDWYIRVTKSH